MFTTIYIPTRIQNDTASAIFILKKYGREKFPGIENAKIEIRSVIPVGFTEEALEKEGIVLVDIGKGKFDHHGSEVQITSTDLVCKFLGVIDNPALEKLRKYVERCDFFGKGIISNDPLDRAFGLPGLLINLNKKHNSEPNSVYPIIAELFDAHVLEEEQRTVGLPKEVEEKTTAGLVDIFSLKHHGKNIKCIYIASDNISLSGYLRSQMGGAYDVAIIHMSTGHINIMTRPAKRVDLHALIAVIRRSELMKRGDVKLYTNDLLSQTGRFDKVPQWYYDPATNSLQNGGINPGQIEKTVLSRKEIIELVKVGLGDR
ncbi:MAG: hypothetical protein V4519_00685 [Patescibacteria group bacterium]